MNEQDINAFSFGMLLDTRKPVNYLKEKDFFLNKILRGVFQKNPSL